MRRLSLAVCILLCGVISCQTAPQPDPDPVQALIDRGEDLFFNETFDGNGRTCGTCHRAEESFGLSPTFISTLPDDDPLFSAEFVPELSSGFENPVLMRELGLIIENLDGFDDLDNNFVMRGIPHTLGLSASVDSALGPRLGWDGAGSPDDGTLRSFAVGAVIQHFPLSTDRIAGVDFRLPTADELDALEAFQLSLGRQQDLSLPLPLRSTRALRGQAIFNDLTTGKCAACHLNAGANANPALLGPGVGNRNFNTGVENLPDQPADLTGELVPPDDGFGTPGDGEFNIPPVVEAADTEPFFHNNSVATLEGAIAFYNGEAFNNSPAGQLIAQASGSGINIDAAQVDAVAAFLRVLNALENIRGSIVALERVAATPALNERIARRLSGAHADIHDAVRVLDDAGLHSPTARDLEQIATIVSDAQGASTARRRELASNAIERLQSARAEMIEESP
jgi:mono/diheme cytochrome c family protein